MGSIPVAGAKQQSIAPAVLLLFLISFTDRAPPFALAKGLFALIDTLIT